MFETIRSMQREAAQLRSDQCWGLAEQLEQQIDAMRERVEMFSSAWSDLIKMASDPVRAAELAGRLDGYAEIEQKVSRLSSALFAEKLISQKQFTDLNTRLAAPTPTENKMQSEVRTERARLDTIFNKVLDRVGRENRMEALNCYRELSGSKSDAKMREWVSKLIGKGMLPKTYAVSMRFDDWFSRLFGSENKQLRPKENKGHGI